VTTHPDAAAAQRKGPSQHTLLEGLALAVLLALALPRHAPHQPPRAAPRLLLRRRFARRRLRDRRRAAAPRQLDRFFFFYGLPRVFDLFGRAGPVLKKLLGDLFGLLLVADDLCGCRVPRGGTARRAALRVALSGYAKAVVSVRRDPPRRRRQDRSRVVRSASLGCPKRLE
jgi:hypothetical protein